MESEGSSPSGPEETRTGLSNWVLGILLAVFVVIWFLVGIVWIVVY